LKQLFTICSALLLALPTMLLATETRIQKPNIVVFLADDMPWHYPGFNGGPVATPNLDRLAKEGTRLTRFYVHSVCSLIHPSAWTSLPRCKPA